MKTKKYLITLLILLTLPNLLLAERVDKLAIGSEYSVSLFTLDSSTLFWEGNVKASLEMRYGSIFALIHNFTIGYGLKGYEQVHTLNYGYDFGVRLYAGDYVFFDGSIGLRGYSALSGEYIDTFMGTKTRGKNGFTTNVSIGIGFNIPLTEKLALLLQANVGIGMDSIYLANAPGSISALFQFKV